MKNANNFILNTIETFANSIPHDTNIPGIRYAQLTLDIQTKISDPELMDADLKNTLVDLFKNLLSEFGTDIPNDTKDDIIFIVDEYIVAWRTSQAITMALRQNLSFYNGKESLPEGCYADVHDHALETVQTIQNDFAYAHSGINEIINNFKKILADHNVTDKISGIVHVQIYSTIEELLKLLLDN